MSALPLVRFRLQLADDLPDTVAPCVPVSVKGGSTVWHRATYVIPAQIDWSGFRHAGGYAERRARSGSSGSTTPESGRSRKQFLLRVTDEERETIESTRREGESSSAAVVRLAREEIDRGKTRDS